MAVYLKIISYQTTKIGFLFLFFPVICCANISTDLNDSLANTNIIAKNLDFTISPNNLCHGFYFEPIIYPMPKDKIRITANNGFIAKDKPSKLSDNVQVQHKGQLVQSDMAIIYTNSKTSKIEKIDLFDNIKIREKGKLLIGKKGNIDLVKETTTIEDAYFRIALSKQYKIEHKSLIWLNNVGWGKAKLIKGDKDKTFVFEQSSFSTCPPTMDDWSLTSQKLVVTPSLAYANHAVFWIKKVPVFYTPYISFPINQQRKSGVLTPTYEHSTHSGYAIELPFYLNLAPNYDLTFTPKLFTERGVMLGQEFRYLTKTSKGELNLNLLPFDRKFKTSPPIFRLFDKHRGEINFLHKTQFNKYWSGDINYNAVTDDDYIKDFHHSHGDYQNNQLLRQGNIQFNSEHFYLLGQVEAYQTLKPDGLLSPTNAYNKLPKIVANINYPKLGNYVNLDISNDLTYFRWPTKPIPNSWSDIIRFHTNPSINAPIKSAYGTITPYVGLWNTNYRLYGNQTLDQKTRSTTTPIISLDLTSTLEKDLVLGYEKYLHQITPRIKYVYIPHQNQSKSPLIDSNYYLFNFEQIFRNNRFSGLDRIGDTNHISLGLSSKLVKNQPLIETGIGQMIYFNDRKTLLCSSNSCKENKFVGYIPINELFSPTTSYVKLNLSPALSIKTDMAWHYKRNEIFNANANLQYKSHFVKPFNFGYSYLKNGDKLIPSIQPTFDTQDLHQLYTSAHIPLTENWHLYGYLSYNLKEKYFNSYFGVLEYNSCCWAVRLLAGKFLLGLDTYRKPSFNKSIRIQITLKGLGYYQSANMQSLLHDKISGFDDHLK